MPGDSYVGATIGLSASVSGWLINDRPFLLWYASATAHAPHQAPPEWIDRFRGHFDDGWDAWRAATLARQIELGIVPTGTELSERPPWIEPWSAIDAPGAK